MALVEKNAEELLRREQHSAAGLRGPEFPRSNAWRALLPERMILLGRGRL